MRANAIPSLLLFLALTPPTAAHADKYEVVIGPGLVYTPSLLTIAAGDTVRFIARDEHPLRSDTDLFLCFEDCVIRFDTPGKFGFHCETHGGPGTGMSGVVIVQAPERVFASGFEPAAARAVEQVTPL